MREGILTRIIECGIGQKAKAVKLNERGRFRVIG
jgi:hypothetical protein